MDTSLISVPFLTPQELTARMGRADAPLLLDVRREAIFLDSPCMLAGAQRCAPEDVTAFATSQPLKAPTLSTSCDALPSEGALLAGGGPALRTREVVVYCVYGHNVSADAVAALRAAGWNAYALAGGIAGGEDGVDTPQDIARWRAHRPPTMAKRPDLGVTGEQASRWITRERPKIDRIACPWLVLRVIDPRAEFFYVPTAQVFDEAKRLNAVAYDIPGAPISHEGERCSFDTLLRAFDLHDPALERLAAIVRGADTDRLDLAPQAAGLLAVSLGLSQLHQDDHAMLEVALPLYDALYAWCRQVTAGQDEKHNWKPETMMGPKK